MMMETLKLTKEHFDSDGFYLGETDITQFDGHIEIAAKLGRCRFRARLAASGRIRAGAGTAIEAGEGCPTSSQ